MQGKSIILTTSFIKLITAFILLTSMLIKLMTAFIKLLTAKTKLKTEFNILATANIILSTVTIKWLTGKYNLVTEKIHLTGATINRKQFATAQEKAHLQSATSNATPKIAKELFPFPLLPTLKKRINFLHSNPKNQPCRIDGTAYNKSFARLRGKVQNSSLLPIFEHWCLIESFGIFSPQPRKAPSRYSQCAKIAHKKLLLLMEIEIKSIITNEYLNGNFSAVDLNDLEDYLNKQFGTKSYGESVVKYFFGFELYKFDGGFAQFFNDEIESWKFKSKWLVVNVHFDWNVFIDLDQKETFEKIKSEFLKSVDRIENMKRKPKKFDNKLFRQDLEIVLESYQNK